MLPDQKDLLSVFNQWDVEYLVVGGHAVTEHAQPRATKDLDVFVRASRDNSEKIYHALAEYGAPLEEVDSSYFCSNPDGVFQIGVEPNRIDILQSISAVTFDAAWPNRVLVTVDGVPAPFISRDDLIQNKLGSGRLRDLADVEELRKAAKAASESAP